MSHKHVVTEASRIEVKALVSFGITQEDICAYLRISVKTLHKYYRYEIDTAVTQANAKVANTLFSKAVDDRDTTSCIFWLKTRARWKEPKEEGSVNTSLIENVIDKIDKTIDNTIIENAIDKL